MSSIYMDNQATTRVDPRVVQRMLPFFGEDYGNAASRGHAFGWKAEEAVEVARSAVAQLLGTSGREIIFTSGATESNNLALLGLARAYARRGNHIITQATEHASVRDVLAHLEGEGVRITYLPVDAYGRVEPVDVARAIEDETIAVSIMAANNEVGTLQPLADIGEICRARGVLLHSDMAQALGKLPLQVDVLKVDVASVSAHKMYGPKGVGALYVRRRDPRVTLAPQMHGGGHERGLRSGTLNVPGIVGFGAACTLAADELPNEQVRLRGLRDRLADGLRDQVGDVYLNGHPSERLAGNLNVAFAGIAAEQLLLALPEIAMSTGSACSSAALAPSHVLTAMAVPQALSRGSVRFGLGRFTTSEEVDAVVARVAEKVRLLRARNPQSTGSRSRGIRPTL